MLRTRVLLIVAACLGGAAAALLAVLLGAGPAGATPTCTIYWTGAHQHVLGHQFELVAHRRRR